MARRATEVWALTTSRLAWVRGLGRVSCGGLDGGGRRLLGRRGRGRTCTDGGTGVEGAVMGGDWAREFAG